MRNASFCFPQGVQKRAKTASKTVCHTSAFPVSEKLPPSIEFGPSLLSLGRPKAPPRSLQTLSRTSLGSISSQVGPTWGQLGPTWPNLSQLGPTWGQLGANLRPGLRTVTGLQIPFNRMVFLIDRRHHHQPQDPDFRIGGTGR